MTCHKTPWKHSSICLRLSSENSSPYPFLRQDFSTSSIFSQFITIIALIKFSFRSTCLHNLSHQSQPKKDREWMLTLHQTCFSGYPHPKSPNSPTLLTTSTPTASSKIISAIAPLRNNPLIRLALPASIRCQEKPQPESRLPFPLMACRS